MVSSLVLNFLGFILGYLFALNAQPVFYSNFFNEFRKSHVYFKVSSRKRRLEIVKSIRISITESLFIFFLPIAVLKVMEFPFVQTSFLIGVLTGIFIISFILLISLFYLIIMKTMLKNGEDTDDFIKYGGAIHEAFYFYSGGGESELIKTLEEERNGQ